MHKTSQLCYFEGDACNRPESCTEGDILPSPLDCKHYFKCEKNHGGHSWYKKSCHGKDNFDQVGNRPLFCFLGVY